MPQPSEQNAPVHALVAKWRAHADEPIESFVSPTEYEARRFAHVVMRGMADELERALASEPRLLDERTR